MGLLRGIENFFWPRSGATDPIKHVVLLMFENHSFDQMLGCLGASDADVEGVDSRRPRSNKDSTGQEYWQRQSNDPVVSPDPKHELDHVLNQLKDDNSGFVLEYEREYAASQPTTFAQRQRIMDYFGDGDLSVLHELAKQFTVCDHWYSSVPGPTWANRFFVHSATSKGLVTMPTGVLQTKYYAHYDQDTIFDRLNDAGKRWHVYFGDIPQSLVLTHQRRPWNTLHYRLMHEFFDDVATGSLPDYSLIEPNYFKGEQNDDHPPHATGRAQRLLATVYNSIRGNQDLWESTLLVVLYDEHGGFYDHVVPPAAVPPDEHQDEYSFDRLGVRVPAILISPWVDRRVVHTQFDHTSLLKYLIDKCQMRSLTDRDREATSIAGAIRTRGTPRTDTPPSVAVPPLVATMLAAALPHGAAADMTVREFAEPINELQQSLMVFSKHLEERELPPTAPRVAMAAGPLSEEQLAKQRVLAFLDQQRAKAVAGSLH